MNYGTVYARLILHASFLVCLAGNQPAISQTKEANLAKLQNEFAVRFLEPEPHMALAKYYLDHGKRLEAFYTLEAARRGHFAEAIFNTAFYRAFDGFDNSSAAEARLLSQHKLNPELERRQLWCHPGHAQQQRPTTEVRCAVGSDDRRRRGRTANSLSACDTRIESDAQKAYSVGEDTTENKVSPPDK